MDLPDQYFDGMNVMAGPDVLLDIYLKGCGSPFLPSFIHSTRKAGSLLIIRFEEKKLNERYPGPYCHKTVIHN